MYRVLSSLGDEFCSGNRYDDKLMEYVIKCFHKTHPVRKKSNVNQALSEIPSRLYRIRAACINAKKELAEHGTAMIRIPELYPDLDYQLELEQDSLIPLWEQFTAMSQTLVTEALKRASVKAKDITECVLIGHLTTLALQATFSNMFSNDCKFVLLDRESIATGAANIAKKTLVDCNQHAIGVELPNGSMLTVFDQFTPIPRKVSQKFLPLPNQSKILLQVYEGQRRQENLLFKSEVEAPQTGIQIFFSLDANGVLQVETNSRILYPQLVPDEIGPLPVDPANADVVSGMLFQLLYLY